MRIQDIEELRTSQEKRVTNWGVPQNLRRKRTPLHETCSACEDEKEQCNASKPLLTRKEQSRDERKGKKPTRPRKFTACTAGPRHKSRPLEILAVR
jgi:hypothetical protein